ncbi:hypothetical protein FWF74_03455 [Candidatus Saccharibacteria bacterium]|nr:hypothetical protein [Candidatus Saccharibacteria bacterium]MCL1962905.1 hypothetical protein [Candidatus Saccharibacteria bacterium]
MKVIATVSYKYDGDYLDDLKENIKDIADEVIIKFDEKGIFLKGAGEYRAEMYRQAEQAGADYILVIDPDERLEKKSAVKIRKLLEKYYGQRVSFEFNFREMYTPTSYRIDGIWGEKKREMIFSVFPDNVYPDVKLHEPRCPVNDDCKRIKTGLNVYHLKHIKPELRKHRKELYKKLDPKSKWNGDAGYDYLDDEIGMKLKKVPSRRMYKPVYRDYKIDEEIFNITRFDTPDTFMGDRNTNLKGKRILITSFSLAAFGGAEMNVIELAEQLNDFGVDTELFSYDIDGPLAQYVREKYDWKIITDDINVLATEEEKLGNVQLEIERYDYIWVNANILPISIIKQINSAKKLPKFIFLHMSSLVGFPLDAPLLPDFEKEIATKILSISDEATEDNLTRIFGKCSVGYYRNPVPKEFKNLPERCGKLRKIAVISSSQPSLEILEISKSLESQAIKVDYIGAYNNNARHVDAEFYNEYDLIIGIGKNVNYSLMSGVPVYIYGRFGGCGYLNEDNFNDAKRRNFSGRGFGRKKAGVISDEIVKGYLNALEFHKKHRKTSVKDYSIDVVVKNLFADIDKQKPRKVKFSKEYINWLVSMQIVLILWLQRGHAINNQVGDLYARLRLMDAQIGNMLNSKSWKITKPLRELKKIITRE